MDDDVSFRGLRRKSLNGRDKKALASPPPHGQAMAKPKLGSESMNRADLQSAPRLWHADYMTIRPEDIGSKKPATKGDLEQLREDLQVDMANLEARFGEKLDSWGQTLFDKLETLIENRAVDAGAAKKEHVSLLDNEVTQLAQRIAALERHHDFE